MDLNLATAGSIAAFSVDMLVYPLDTIKTRYQSAPKGISLLSISYRNLYAGVGPVVAATLPSAAVFFTTYEQLGGLLRKSTSFSAPITQIIASNIAECASCAVLAPAELIKQNAQVENKENTATLTRRLFRRENIRTLLAGYRALVFRNLPFTTVQWPIYEHFKKLFRSKDFSRGQASGMAAMIAGTAASTATTPVDVVKTRIMIQNQKSGGVWSTTKDVISSDGVKGLFRGGLLRSSWAALGAGVYLGSFEKAKESLGKD
ncbi:hypothetical protein E3Q13_03504 [Wallemia mellicola]|nr:hypothetical protein E3Q13_03504 [Wallemia mellicola]